MPTIDADIMCMDQEDMVDEIMTLRQKNAELVEALAKVAHELDGVVKYCIKEGEK
jgi:hypothetical protein